MARLWEILRMKTVIVDDKKRIRLPDVKPRQVFAYEDNGEGSVTLRLIKTASREPFPKGSLARYFNRAKDKQELDLLGGCSLGVE